MLLPAAPSSSLTAVTPLMSVFVCSSSTPRPMPPSLSLPAPLWSSQVLISGVPSQRLYPGFVSSSVCLSALVLCAVCCLSITVSCVHACSFHVRKGCYITILTPVFIELVDSVSPCSRFINLIFLSTVSEIHQMITGEILYF